MKAYITAAVLLLSGVAHAQLTVFPTAPLTCKSCSISAAVLSGTMTGTYTLGGTPTITSPTLSGTVSGQPTWASSQTFPGLTSSGTATFNGAAVIGASMRVHRVTVADAGYTTLSTDMFIAYTSISATRAVIGSTLGGIMLVITDESGSASATNTITFQPTSGTIDGAASKVCVNSSHGACRVYCDGTNWHSW